MTTARLGSSSIHEVVGGQACKGRLDDVTGAMLLGVFIDETVCSSRSDCGSENALALLSSPGTGFFARAKSLDSTGCQGGTSCLGNALFTPLTATMRAIAAITAARP